MGALPWWALRRRRLDPSSGGGEGGRPMGLRVYRGDGVLAGDCWRPDPLVAQTEAVM